MLAVALGVAAAWYVPAFIAGRANALGGVFIDENFGHFLPAKMGGTGEAARPIYYIVIRLLGGVMPLTFLVPALILAFATGAFAPRVRPAMRYQLAMVLAVLVLFSASSAKRDDYILPAIPPLAVLFCRPFPPPLPSDSAARYVPDRSRFHGRCDRRRYAPRRRRYHPLCTCGHTVTRPQSFHLQSSDTSFVAIFLAGMTHLPPPFVAFVTAIAIGATVIASALMRRSPLRSGAGLAILCLAGSMLWTKSSNRRRWGTRSLRPFADEVRARIGAEALFVAFMDPEFAWYYGSGVPVMPCSDGRFGTGTGHGGLPGVTPQRTRAIFSAR